MSCVNCRLRAAGRNNADGAKKARMRDRTARAIPAPEANAELQANIDVCCLKLIFLVMFLLFLLLKSLLLLS